MVTTSNRLAQLFLDHTEYLSDRWEHYLGIYQLELAHLTGAGKPVSLLEIGVQNGGSLQIWSKYLPPGSQILGIDIDEKCAALETPPNVRIVIGDASDPLKLLRMLGGDTFDIIIDDGSHRSADIIATFETCFDRLNPGGLYFVEDLHCSYMQSFGGGYREPQAAIEWFKGLVDALNCDHLDDSSGLSRDEMTRLVRLNRAVARVAFYDSVAVIEKFQGRKTHPFRRLLTGSQMPVADVAPVIWSMPPRQIAAFRLAPATSAAFSSTWAELLVTAKEESQALRAANASEAARLADAYREAADLRAELARKEADLRAELAGKDADLRAELALLAEVERQQRSRAEAAVRQREETAVAWAEETAGLRSALARLEEAGREQRAQAEAAAQMAQQAAALWAEQAAGLRAELARLEAAERQQRERAEAALRQAEDALRQREEALRHGEEAGVRWAEQVADLRTELSRLSAELVRLGTEMTEARAAQSAAETAVSDHAAQHSSISVALARSDAHLQAILASTSWQVARRLAAVAGHFSPRNRLLARRAMRVAWWTATGRLRERLALYRRARHEGMDALRPPPPLPAPVALPVEMPIALPVSQPIALPVEQPIAQAVEAPMALAVEAPMGLPVEAPIALPVEQRPTVEELYHLWWSASAPHPAALRLQRRQGESLGLRPAFSVIVPVFQPPADVFTAMIASVQAQSYQNWELILAIVDTGAQSAELLRHASEASQSDPRIQIIVLPDNLGISGNSNVALARATGDWIVLLDHDDTIGHDSLFRFAESLNLDPAADFLYSDKDMIDRDGARHFSPLMKPAWSPDIMLNANYLTHLCALRTELVRGIGGWDTQTDGAQDWDLFLRSFLAGARIRHVPYVLYHWRQIPTSVSVGGFAAKPYAADGQLRTLRKYLASVGWGGAEPAFQGDYIRIRWRPNGQRVSVVLIGSPAAPLAADPGVEVIAADPKRLVASVDAAIGQASGDVIIILDAGFVPKSSCWVAEMVYPLSNPAVAMIAGKALDRNDRIVDFGVFLRDGIAYPAWREQPELYYGCFGGAGWYRNVSAAAGGAVAFRRTLWSELGGFGAFARSGRPDLGFSLAAAGTGRILANPFALFTAADGPSVFEKTLPPLQPDAVRAALPNGDPFLSPNMEVETVPGLPRIVPPAPPPPRPPPHDYAAEAGYVAHVCDVDASEIAASIEACANMPAGPLRHVLWLIPDFQVPFFGGIHTILRVAEHLRVHHNVKQSFAVVGITDVAVIRARMARAFPDLAANARIEPLTADGSTPSFGPVCVAFATLWTTAFPLLRLRGVRRKCYFLQDWEPLFYPAGTLSGIVEATYRFGFHAICNTPSLAESYRAMGGTADYFLPAVDTKIFNASGRVARRSADPFLIFCYGRPTIPRNCFEVLAEGLSVVKRKYGDEVEIVFAGGEWDPADYGLGGLVRNMGLLSYAGTGQLYRSVDAGLVAMATRHPSYLPFELMASGAAVVTTRNVHTSWLLQDQENCLLCETSRSDIARAISLLIEQPAVRDRIAQAGQDLVARDHADWDQSCRRIAACIRTVAAGRTIDG